MKRILYTLICFFFIGGCFPNERKEVTECKLEIERAEKIRNSFGYIETGLDINEIYTEDPESPRKVDCENVDTERVKNITEIMRKKNSYNANSPILLERKALIEIDEFKKAHEEQLHDFKYFDNVLLAGNVEDYETLGRMLYITIMCQKTGSSSGKELKTGLWNNMGSGAARNLKTGIFFLKNIKTFQMKRPRETKKNSAKL